MAYCFDGDKFRLNLQVQLMNIRCTSKSCKLKAFVATNPTDLDGRNSEARGRSDDWIGRHGQFVSWIPTSRCSESPGELERPARRALMGGLAQ